MHLSLIETFTTVQGEGPSVGEPAYFIRLAGCNLACTWCDTRYSWDWDAYDRSAEVSTELVEDVALRVAVEAPSSVSLVVVTGGEPLLQRTALTAFLRRLRVLRPSVRVEIETNGTIEPGRDLAELVHLFVVSPKLANAGAANMVPAGVVASFSTLPSILKVVVTESEDVGALARLANAAGFDAKRVWISPEGTTVDAVADHATKTVAAAIENGFHVSPRLHITIWGDERRR